LSGGGGRVLCTAVDRLDDVSSRPKIRLNEVQHLGRPSTAAKLLLRPFPDRNVTFLGFEAIDAATYFLNLHRTPLCLQFVRCAGFAQQRIDEALKYKLRDAPQILELSRIAVR
jgi:hypothetical protein